MGPASTGWMRYLFLVFLSQVSLPGFETALEGHTVVCKPKPLSSQITQCVVNVTLMGTRLKHFPSVTDLSLNLDTTPYAALSPLRGKQKQVQSFAKRRSMFAELQFLSKFLSLEGRFSAVKLCTDYKP